MTKEWDRKTLDWFAQLKAEGKLETTRRHEQFMTLYRLAKKNYPEDEVFDVLLAVFPGLDEEEFAAHLTLDAMRQLAPASH